MSSELYRQEPGAAPYGGMILPRSPGLALALLALLFVVLLPACAAGLPTLPVPGRERTPWVPPTPVVADTPVPPTATPRPPVYGGRLTVRLREEVGAINPLNASGETRRVAQLIFSGLMRLDAQLRPVPDLAESWTASPDELTWTFKLRPGVRWHDGTTLTSEDVLFTYRTLLDAPLAGEPADGDLGVGVAQADLQQVVEDIEALDPYTVNFKLRRRFAPLLTDLTVPVLPYQLLKGVPSADLWRVPIEVGSGPFYLREKRGQEALILDAFPDYFLGRPYLDRVAFLVAPDEDTLANALAEEQLMLAEVSAATAAQLANRQNVQVLSYPDLTYYYVGFNLRAGRLFANKQLRQAWSHAVDKEAVLASTLGTQASPIWSGVPSYSWAFDSTLPKPTRDLAQARQLLDAAGWQQLDKDGIRQKGTQRLSIELAVRHDAPERIKVAQAMASQLREAGIEVRVAPSDYSSTMAAARQPPFDFAALMMGWTIAEDPDDYYLFHSSQIPSAERPSGYNYVGFRNEEFDRLSVEARGTTDWRRREELYRRTQRIIAEEQPYYFLWAERAYVAVNRRLEGVPEPISPSFWSSLARWQMVRK